MRQLHSKSIEDQLGTSYGQDTGTAASVTGWLCVDSIIKLWDYIAKGPQIQVEEQ